jgi:hypothetical protein
MSWNIVHAATDLEAMKQLSYQQLVLMFKHSICCSISAAALKRSERQRDTTRAGNLALQMLLIQEGKCIYHASHLDIHFANVMQFLSQPLV